MVDDLFIVDDKGDGPSVLLLHGQPGTHDLLEPVAGYLRGHARVITLDRPGYGRSSALPPMSMVDQADLFAELLRSLEAAPAVVVGHSLGGGIALMLAARHPDVVSGLVLVASIGGEGSIAAADRLMAMPVLGRPISWVSLAAYGVLGPVVARRSRRASLAGNVPTAPTTVLLDDFPTFFFEQQRLVAEGQSLTDSIAEVHCPAVVIQGDLDEIVPPDAGRDLHNRLEKSRYLRLTGQGHLIPRDAAGDVATAVDSLLA